jgi:hypothetical protein
VDVRSEKLFRNRLDAKKFEFNLETKVSQKGKTFYFKKKPCTKWSKTIECANV